ncbi:MAG TPA: 1-acyl-sn-glycerol-3-phosphate acyltransferase, partial [Longimicrobiales bacterium]|nr:1-acyl-sn-glycerol-3-phosphate acyltransferase [Longimicrobiales bacterium]
MAAPSRQAEGARRRAGAARGRLSPDSPLVGGRPGTGGSDERALQPPPPEFDPRHDVYEFPSAPAAQLEREQEPDLRALRRLIPADDSRRALDDWGRSERVLGLMAPLLDFYYDYWFRVEAEGVENVPADGGALLVANHSGALPPDATMIMWAIRREHPSPRPLYMLGEHWFKGYPGVG